MIDENLGVEVQEEFFIADSSLDGSHYSKSQIFVQKLNFDKTPTFSRVFHPIFC